jgi:hypothetical protein
VPLELRFYFGIALIWLSGFMCRSGQALREIEALKIESAVCKAKAQP